MNILVTGASGFIGRNLSLRLISQGHQVIGLSLKSPSDFSIGFKDYHQQDIARPFALKGHFDLVIHLAAYNITHVGSQDQDLYTAINVEGTRHLLEAVQSKKFLYLSTAKVYNNEGLPLTEESPLRPQGAYAQSKFEAEEVCRSVLRKESLVILRSVNVIGWGQAPKAVVPVFFQKAKANQPLDILSAHAVMQFVYVDDLIDAIEAVSDRESESGIFNIAHKETVSLEYLARTIVAMTHSSSVINISKNTVDSLFSPVICDKAYQSFGWKAKTDLAAVLNLYQEAYARVP